MGKVLSVVSNPFKNFNLESRAHKIIGRGKPLPAPKYKKDEIGLDRLMKEYPEVYEESLKKNEQLDKRLKDVYVTSHDPNIKIGKQAEDPNVNVKVNETPKINIKQEENANINVKVEENPDINVKQEKNPNISVKQEANPNINVKQEANPNKQDENPNINVKSDENPKINVKQEGNPNRPLPSDRTPPDIHLYGVKEPDKIPLGKTTLRQALEFITQHQSEPQTFTPKKISEEYNVPVGTIRSILKFYRVFEVYIPQERRPKARFAGPSIPKVQVIKDIRKGLPPGSEKNEKA